MAVFRVVFQFFKGLINLLQRNGNESAMLSAVMAITWGNTMSFSANHLAELNLLTQFPSTSTQEGIKVHAQSAAPETVQAAENLHARGLISQKDGGYLTPSGIEAAELAQKLQSILSH